jgi:hypothetical protein
VGVDPLPVVEFLLWSPLLLSIVEFVSWCGLRRSWLPRFVVLCTGTPAVLGHSCCGGCRLYRSFGSWTISSSRSSSSRQARSLRSLQSVGHDGVVGAIAIFTGRCLSCTSIGRVVGFASDTGLSLVLGGDGSHSCAYLSCGLQYRGITVGSISLGCC